MDLLDVREKIRDAVAPLADAGSNIDSGFGLGQADLWVWIDGTEYSLSIQRVERRPAASVQ